MTNWNITRQVLLLALLPGTVIALSLSVYFTSLQLQALDRALMAGRYVIPLWYSDRGRIAHDARLRYPSDRLPVYGDWQGFQPEIWWYDETSASVAPKD